MNVKERQLVSVRHASAHPSRVSADCTVLAYSRSPSSAHVSFVGGFGLGVADVQVVDEVGVEVDVCEARQLLGKVVMVVVLVRFTVILL